MSLFEIPEITIEILIKLDYNSIVNFCESQPGYLKYCEDEHLWAQKAQKDNKQLQEAQRRINDLENQINKLTQKAQKNPQDQSIRNKLDKLQKGKERIVKYAWKKRKEAQNHAKDSQKAQTQAQKSAQEAQQSQTQTQTQQKRWYQAISSRNKQRQRYAQELTNLTKADNENTKHIQTFTGDMRAFVPRRPNESDFDFKERYNTQKLKHKQLSQAHERRKMIKQNADTIKKQIDKLGSQKLDLLEKNLQDR